MGINIDYVIYELQEKLNYYNNNADVHLYFSDEFKFTIEDVRNMLMIIEHFEKKEEAIERALDCLEGDDGDYVRAKQERFLAGLDK